MSGAPAGAAVTEAFIQSAKNEFFSKRKEGKKKSRVPQPPTHVSRNTALIRKSTIPGIPALMLFPPSGLEPESEQGTCTAHPQGSVWLVANAIAFVPAPAAALLSQGH